MTITKTIKTQLKNKGEILTTNGKKILQNRNT